MYIDEFYFAAIAAIAKRNDSIIKQLNESRPRYIQLIGTFLGGKFSMNRYYPYGISITKLSQNINQQM